MSVLTFTLKVESRQRIDVSSLTPDRLDGMSLDEIGKIGLQSGNRSIPTKELFTIQGSGGTDRILFKGATGKLDAIGQGMSRGEIEVDGDAGSYTGLQMRGGRILVRGSIGPYGACEMRSGVLIVHGNAGDFLGGCLPGNKKGMAGGVVIVRGNVADRAGDHMRRGAILIEGSAGDYLGSRMTAGTIAVLGKVGANIGYAMGRGTLLLGQPPEAIPPTFNDCGTHTLGFIPLLLKGFAEFDTPFSGMSDQLKRVHRYAGDLCALGKGEILVAAG